MIFFCSKPIMIFRNFPCKIHFTEDYKGHLIMEVSIGQHVVIVISYFIKSFTETMIFSLTSSHVTSCNMCGIGSNSASTK